MLNYSGSIVYDSVTQTYYIDDQPKCFRPLRDRSANCQQTAGFRTEHVGIGACMWHGGAVYKATQMQIETGRYAGLAYGQLKRHYERFIIEPDFLDITPELALARGLLADELKAYHQDRRAAKAVLKIILDITAIVERIEKIQSQQVLTATTVRLMMARGLDVAKDYIPPEQLLEFVERWRDEPAIKLSSFLPASVTRYED